MRFVTVIDTGVGNLFSLCSAIRTIGWEPKVCSSAVNFFPSQKVILPGVGSYGAAISNLEGTGLKELLIDPDFLDSRQILGICLGFQLLFNGSEESSLSPGLNFLPGIAKKLEAKIDLKVPHVGFNEASITKDNNLFSKIPNRADFYFLHSYAVFASEYAISYTEYGPYNFVSSISKQNRIFGVQFHPEKSKRDGVRLLQNFLELQL